MPERQYRTLSKRIVDRLAVDGKDAVLGIRISRASVSASTPRASRYTWFNPGRRASRSV